MTLFDATVTETSLNPVFVQLRDEPAYFPARRMMSDVFDAWEDADNQFVRDFQTEGFDARTWELYLRAVLVDIGLSVDSIGGRPDFRCQADGSMFFVEATTSNPPPGSSRSRTPKEAMEQLAAASDDADEIAIRLGSALYSKQQKRYHELPHVAGRPLIFAIEGFHGPGSLFQSDGSLLRLLFGLALVDRVSPGVAVPARGPISEHRHGTKVIPSGWFFHPENEHVSAVLFSNAGTITKFNRMGVQAGYSHPRLKAMLRRVHEFDPNPDAMLPIVAVEHIDESSAERWSEGLVLIQNPNAVLPVDAEWFPDVSVISQAGDQVALRPASRHVFSQFTAIMQTPDDDSES
jgi:hypothetical protein